MIRTTVLSVLKMGLLWVTMLIAGVVAAQALRMSSTTATFVSDGPFSAGQAFLIVNGLHATILAAIAAQSSLMGWRLALLILLTLFFAQSFLLLIEAAYFHDSVGVPMTQLINGGAQTLIVGTIAGITAAFIWRRKAIDRGEDALESRLTNGHMTLRILCVAVLYIICYFAAGYFIAWANADIREYYNQGETIRLIPLLTFQLFRGILWGLLALLLAKNLTGSNAKRALLVGSTFAVLATAQLLYPNGAMPWTVRWPHLTEVLTSNFIFGLLATMILRFRNTD